MQKMNSINATAKLCKEYNIGISRKLIIQLAKEGAIPSVKSGRSILVNWDGLINYLDNCKMSPVKQSTGIREISA